MDEITSLFTIQCQEKKIEIKATIQKNLPPFIKTDP